MEHIGIIEIVSALFGIVFFWVLVYSSEKDVFDAENRAFSLKKWFKTLFGKRNDNILAHLFTSGFILFIGVNNMRSFMGDTLMVPEGADSVGSAGLIGFCGSYIADLLKKAIKITKK